MRKLISFISALIVLTFFYGCTKDVQDQVDQLQQDVNLTIVDVYFVGEDLIIEYSNGETATVTLPESITQTAVSALNFDQATGLLTLTFSDGNTSTYEIINHDQELLLAQDVNGKYYLQEIALGDVSLADFTYDTEKRLTEIAVRFLFNNEVADILKVVNTYSGDQNTGYTMYLYAFQQEANTSQTYVYYSNSVNFDHQLTSEEQLVDNGDGTFTYYSYSYSSGSYYYYYSYSPCVWVPVDDLNECGDADQDYYYPISGNEFYRIYPYNSRWQYKDIDGIYSALVQANYMVTVNSVVEKGNIYDTIKVDVNYNSAGLAEKIYTYTDENDVPLEYILNTYDANNLLVKNEYYVWNDITEVWEKMDEYISHTYNSENLIESSTWHYLNSEDAEETRQVYGVTYDDQNNPVLVSAFMDEDIEWQFVEGTGGEYTYEPVVVRPAGLVDVLKVEYNYNMKNFWGNTWNSIIPELKGLQMNNAPKKILYADHFSYANMEYSDFNEGGYPQTLTAAAKILEDDFFFGPSMRASGPSIYVGGDVNIELTLDYLKLDE
ncbi:MAG: hypothetical protein JXJ22_10630 [Bacteroidales bacterium]|nr:hypothetical protein [Bacteroidales bacterium]